MKTTFVLFLLIILSINVNAQSETGIDWKMSVEELLVKEIDNVVKDTCSNHESWYSFDTTVTQEICVKKTFWNVEFDKSYFFENDKLYFIQTQIKAGEVNYEIKRANLSTYRAYYYRMLELLIDKYGEPTNIKGLDFLSYDIWVELLDNEEDFTVTSEWVLPDETIVLTYLYRDSIDWLLWTLEYTLNSNSEKEKQKNIQKELKEKQKEELELKRRKEESNKVLDDI